MKLTAGQVGQIARGLMDGYGAEDIALDLRVHVDHVRFQISKFRADGRLATMVAEARSRLMIDLRRKGLMA